MVQGNVQVWAPNYEEVIRRNLLFPYAPDVSVYRCPASRAFVTADDGTHVTHNRSYSISASLNCNLVATGAKLLSSIPNPAQVTVFLEENAVSIDNGSIGIRKPDAFSWFWHLPASRHGHSASLTFADGHTETWRWSGPTVNKFNEVDFNSDDTRSQRPNPAINPTIALPTPADDSDRLRLMNTTW